MDDCTRRDVVKLAAAGGAIALGSQAVAAAQEGEREEAQARGLPKPSPEVNEAIGRAMDEANAVFEKLQGLVEEQVRAGSKTLDVLAISRRAGLPLDRGTLDQLKIDPVIPIIPWLHWQIWYPWRPIWCWWWSRYPWYRCCPYWWYRCHWYP